MDALVAIDALDDLIHNAPNAFLSDDVKVDPDEVSDLLSALRAGLVEDIPDARRSVSWTIVDELERAVREGRAVRMGTRVRINADALYELLDRLRATVPDDIRRARGA